MATKITDTFWRNYQAIVKNEMLPYQWKVLNDDADINIERERDDSSIPNEKSHAIENFRIAAGDAEGNHYGWVFQDSDVYKWLEAAAYTLENDMDSELKALADRVVDLIGSAQEEDGYLGTYFTIEEPERKFKRLSESHELYCAGHFLEAAVAYFHATGSKKVVEMARKLADCIDRHFGREEGKIRGYDGHEEIKIGLMRLYHLTGEERYLNLSRFFLYERGTNGNFFERQKEEDPNKTPLIQGLEKFPLSYYQIHKPILEQDTAEGHAVRLVYMCTAMADAAEASKDGRLLNVCRKIWRNIVDKRLYITGGIGSTVIGESFTFDYNLPNDTMYCETCASVGLIFYAYQMLKNEIRGEYGDVMERALYNTALAGMALDGKHFFYVNPLEVIPESSEKDPGKSHVKAIRPEWLGCACCPPNLARLLASLNHYVYLKKETTVYSVLFMNCESEFETENGRLFIKQETEYPYNGTVRFSLNQIGEEELEFAVRIPGWVNRYTVEWNGQAVDMEKKDGYIYFRERFSDDVITLRFDMEIEVWAANPLVRADVGKAAVSRGPFVYCMEGIDNGENLHLLKLDTQAGFRYVYDAELLGGVGVIKALGYREFSKTDALYHTIDDHGGEVETEITLIPYYAWANRGVNEMQVWIRYKE